MGKASAGAASIGHLEFGGRRAGAIDAQIGKRIRQVRSSKRMSQEDLARRIGISCQQLQKYESGANRISASRLVQLADVLDVQIALFLRDQGSEAPTGRVTTDQVGNDAASMSTGCEDLLKLVNSFCSIRNPASRAKIVEMTMFLAGLESADPGR
jgi:transcriptional regulator with XRE-family HTH domain